MHLDAEPLQVGRYGVRSAPLFEGQFGMGVQVAAQRRDSLMKVVVGVVGCHEGMLPPAKVSRGGTPASGGYAALSVSRARFTARSKMGSTGTMLASPRST